MKLLEQMGTDIVSIANNHIYDYGADAMDDTIDLLDQAKINHVGGGTNLDEAKQPTYYIINGIKIGFVAASEENSINLHRKQQIQRQVFLHLTTQQSIIR